jgi:hypothetical protein
LKYKICMLISNHMRIFFAWEFGFGNPSPRNECFESKMYILSTRNEGFELKMYNPSTRNECFELKMYNPSTRNEGFESKMYNPSTRNECFGSEMFVRITTTMFRLNLNAEPFLKIFPVHVPGICFAVRSNIAVAKYILNFIAVFNIFY